MTHKSSEEIALNPLVLNAYKVLRGEELTKTEALELAHEIKGADLLDLVSLAHKVTLEFAHQTPPCAIMNVKSGRCNQNCRFCAQSGFHNTGIKEYPLVSSNEVIAEAGKDYA